MKTLFAAVATALLSIGAAPAAPPSVELRVSAALLADLRQRMGPSASVDIRQLVVRVRDSASGSFAVVPAPVSRVGQPLDFNVVGASNGRASLVGRGRATVDISVPHATVRRTLARGAVLTADDLTLVVGTPGRVPLRRLPSVEELLGATLKRDVTDGEVVTLTHVTLPLAVKSGDVVHAMARFGIVEVTGELTALDSGAPGAVIRAVNRDSRRAVRVRIVKPGIVEVIQ